MVQFRIGARERTEDDERTKGFDGAFKHDGASRGARCTSIEPFLQAIQ
jgi:hypothetical protein